MLASIDGVSTGMGCDEMCRIGGWILKVMHEPDDEKFLRVIRGRVAEFGRRL